MRNIFALVFLLTVSITYAQEVLSPMGFNPHLYYPALNAGRIKPLTHHRHKDLIQDSVIVITTDTLRLPFIDDFTYNTIKPDYTYLGYSTNAIGPCNSYMGVRTTTDTFSQLPTFIYSYNVGAHHIDSVPNAPIKFYYYPGVSGPITGSCFNQLGDSLTLYPKGYKYTFDTSSGFITSQKIDTTKRDTILSYAPVIFRQILPSGNACKWVDRNAYHNYTSAVLPPTIGVATLDGLDQYGRPYDNSSSTSWGIADYLTSKPIDLSQLATGDTTLYLSFFYQPGGFGDAATGGDSLCLEFFNSYTNQWDRVWSTFGDTLYPAVSDPFRQVLVRVDTNILPTRGYFSPAFQFRFLNYGSLAGNNDIWNIDYVRLDRNRFVNDTVISDIAFQYQFPSILKNFEQMPAWQFTGAADLADSLALPVSNLNEPQAVSNPPATTFHILARETYPLTSQLFTTTSTFNAASENYITLYPGRQYTAPALPHDSLLTISSQATLDVNDYLAANDTISRTQVLENILAYDDGTAERAYGLQNLGLKKFAYDFRLNYPDTIVGYQVMYSYVDDDVHDLVFQFNLWTDSLKLNNVFFHDTPVWTSNNTTPYYGTGQVNGFATYRLDSPIAVPRHFYFGWAQTDTRNLQIGYDINSTKGSSHMFIYTNGRWDTSTIGILGSPMIRLIMKRTNLFSSGIREASIQSIKAYPNPTNGQLNFDLPDEHSYKIDLYNTMGQLCHSSTLSDGNKTLDIAQLPASIYLMRLTDLSTGVTYQNKIQKEQ